MGFFRKLVKLAPSILLKRLWNTFVYFSFSRRLDLRGSLLVQATDILETSTWSEAHRRGILAISNFRERLMTLRTCLSVGRQERFPTDAHSWMVASVCSHCRLFSHLKLATQEKWSTKKRLDPDSLRYLVPTTPPVVFLGRCFSVKMSRITARQREVLTAFFSYVVTTPHHRCSAANMAWDPMASFGRMLTILWFWLVA